MSTESGDHDGGDDEDERARIKRHANHAIEKRGRLPAGMAAGGGVDG